MTPAGQAKLDSIEVGAQRNRDPLDETTAIDGDELVYNYLKRHFAVQGMSVRFDDETLDVTMIPKED